MDNKTIIKSYNTTKSSFKTAKILAVTQKRVMQALHEEGVVSKFVNQGNKKHEKDLNFFSNPSLVNSYWAGFIAADGHISQDNGVIIALDTKDKKHLNAFKRAIKFSGEIKTYEYKEEQITWGKFTFKPKPYCRISIYGKKLCDDLRENFGVVRNKTKTIEFPKHLKEDCLFAFVMGYIDGDGSFALSKGKLSALTICGRQEFLTDCANFLTDYLKETPDAIKIYKEGSIFAIHIHRKNTLIKLRKVVEKKFNNLPFLERKWERLFQAEIDVAHFNVKSTDTAI